MVRFPPAIPSVVLAPIDTDAFFSRYWERTPLHIERSDKLYFADWLSVADIEQLLSSQDLHYPTVQLTQSDQSIALHRYASDGRIIPSRLLELHRQGATIVLSQSQRLLPRLGELCRQLYSDFQLRCQANVYLSPPGYQGFRPHYDTHDVLILQISGSKSFRFYEQGVELPFAEERFDPETFDAGSRGETITLTAGDTLYIPRGLTHDAVADDEQRSLHVTVGVFAATITGLLQEIVMTAAEQDSRLRESLPRHWWTGQGSPEVDWPVEIGQILQSVATKLRSVEAMSRLRDEVALSCPEHVVGTLTSRCAVPTIEPDTLVRVRTSAWLNLEHHVESVRLRLHGRILEFNQTLGGALDALVLHGELQVQALPGLEPEQQVVLVRRLLDENLVELIPS